MVIISNGFSKFHMAVAAAELHKHGTLSLLLTGAYPKVWVRSILQLPPLSGNRKLARLLDRGENIPDSMVHPLWFSEFVYQFGMMLRRFKSLEIFSKWLNVTSFKLYGSHAVRYIKQSHPQKKIYHYRAGFGGKSVRLAKERGMFALCDHSIAHPAVLEYLVKNQGRFPPLGAHGHMDHMWTDILEDIEQADAVLVNSEFVKETFLHLGWDSSPIHVIYWGVDDQFFFNIPHRFDRKAGGVREVRLLASSLESRKGVDTLIPALEKILDLRWNLQIAGSISSEIQDQYSSFFSNPKVTTAGWLRRNDLAQHMATADIFIFPSLAEGSARVIFEALACGCYVITTPNSGSIVEHGVHGALVPPGDADALTEAIRLAIQQREKLTEIGHQNAELVRSRYRQEHYGNALENLYNKLLQ